MKKLFVFFAGLMLAVLMALPANAAFTAPWDHFDQIGGPDCPSQIDGHIAGNSDEGNFDVQGNVQDGGSGAPHNWDFWIYHNGVNVRSGSQSGSFNVNLPASNWAGSDTFKWVVKNNSRTMTCTAQITFG